MSEKEFKKWLGIGEILEEYYSPFSSYYKDTYRGFEFDMPIKGKILKVLKDCNIYDVRATESIEWHLGHCERIYDYKTPTIIQYGYQLTFDF